MTAVALDLLPRSTVLTPGPGRRRTTEELKAIAEDAARRFDDRGLYGHHGEVDPAEVLAWAGETFGDALAVACSMANTVVPEMTAQYAPGVDVLFLDTGTTSRDHRRPGRPRVHTGPERRGRAQPREP